MADWFTLKWHALLDYVGVALAALGPLHVGPWYVSKQALSPLLADGP